MFQQNDKFLSNFLIFFFSIFSLFSPTGIRETNYFLFFADWWCRYCCGDDDEKELKARGEQLMTLFYVKASVGNKKFQCTMLK